MPAATWIAHVKSVYAKGGMTYKQAMQRAAKTWKKSKGAKAAPVRKSRGKKRKAKADKAEPEPEAEDADDEEDEKEAPKKRKRKRARPGPGKFDKNHI